MPSGVVVAAGALPGIALPIAPEAGADMPVPGAAIAPLADGAVLVLEGPMPVPGALMPVPPPEGAIALPGALIPLPFGAIPLPVGAMPLPFGAMPLVDPLAGITPLLAFARLCSLSFAVSASPPDLPFLIMPECLPCI